MPSDSDMFGLDELSGDKDLSDFREDENTNVCIKDPELRSDHEAIIASCSDTKKLYLLKFCVIMIIT